jgi:hypothetical protein
MPAKLIAEVDAWGASNEAMRSEAIRRLVELGLSNASRRQQRAPKENAARAAELAAKVIDKQIAPETPAEERAVRKRKLLQGPSIVREARKDRPKWGHAPVDRDRAEGEEVSRLIELLQTFELGHGLIIAGGILMVLGALSLLIRRSRRTGSEIEDEVTPTPAWIGSKHQARALTIGRPAEIGFKSKVQNDRPSPNRAASSWGKARRQANGWSGTETFAGPPSWNAAWQAGCQKSRLGSS